MKGLNEFLNERKTIQVKRKYSQYAPISVGANAPVRQKILGFIAEKGSCCKADLVEYIKTANEESGRKTNLNWLKKNAKYLTTFEQDGETHYKLSKLGSRVVKATTINESNTKGVWTINYYADSYQYAEPEVVKGSLEDAKKQAVAKLVSDVKASSKNVADTFWATFTLKGDRMDQFDDRVKVSTKTGKIEEAKKNFKKGDYVVADLDNHKDPLNDLGILPNDVYKVVKVGKDMLTISGSDGDFDVPIDSMIKEGATYEACDKHEEYDEDRPDCQKIEESADDLTIKTPDGGELLIQGYNRHFGANNKIAAKNMGKKWAEFVEKIEKEHGVEVSFGSIYVQPK